jgi:ankyrin repeat protein
MISCTATRVAVVLIAFSAAAALSQELTSKSAITAAPNTIEFIPMLARAVLTGDPKQVDQALQKHEEVNSRVQAKKGARAGFTPLILAASLSNPEIVKALVQNGAKITILDDFRRSALWYAALHSSVRFPKFLLARVMQAT